MPSFMGLLSLNPRYVTSFQFHTQELALTCTLSSLELQDCGIISPLTLPAAQTWKHSGLDWLYTFSKHSESSPSSPFIIIFISIFHHYSSLIKIVPVSQFTKQQQQQQQNNNNKKKQTNKQTNKKKTCFSAISTRTPYNILSWGVWSTKQTQMQNPYTVRR